LHSPGKHDDETIERVLKDFEDGSLAARIFLVTLLSIKNASRVEPARETEIVIGGFKMSGLSTIDGIGNSRAMRAIALASMAATLLPESPSSILSVTVPTSDFQSSMAKFENNPTPLWMVGGAQVCPERTSPVIIRFAPE